MVEKGHIEEEKELSLKRKHVVHAGKGELKRLREVSFHSLEITEYPRIFEQCVFRHVD